MAVTEFGFVGGIWPEGLKEELVSVASKLGDVVEDTSDFEVIRLKGAMTNEVYQLNWPSTDGNEVRKVLVLCYGEGVDLFFNRDDEIRTFECMSKHGQGPRLLGRFPKGRVEEFIHARTLSAADLRDPETSAIVAAKLREFHNLDMPGSRNVVLLDRMRNWLSEAKKLCSIEDKADFRLDTMEEEINMLEKKLSEDSQEIGFCHNDLQYGNIMMDEETKSITIIDYEYASFNPVAYDLANHFCEMMANYHSETPHVLDSTKYPVRNQSDFKEGTSILGFLIGIPSGLDERQSFVRLYLTSADYKPSDVEVAQLVDEVEQYTPASHLFWGLWGIISDYVNKIDFKYKEYARQRFQQYRLGKPA